MRKIGENITVDKTIVFFEKRNVHSLAKTYLSKRRKF